MRVNIYNKSEDRVAVMVNGYLRRVDPKSSLSVTEREADVMVKARPDVLTLDYQGATGKEPVARFSDAQIARLDKFTPGQLIGVIRLMGAAELDLPETEFKKLKRDELQELATHILRHENVDNQSVLRLIETRKSPVSVELETTASAPAVAEGSHP